MTTSKELRIENLRALVAEFKTADAVARLAATAPMYLSQILNGAKSSTGKPRGVGDALARRIEHGCGKYVGWLDVPHHGQDTGKFDSNVSTSSVGTRAIPVISAVQAGLMKEMDSPYAAGDGYAVEYTDDNLSRWAFALDIQGVSMMPEFRPGDRVIIDPNLSPNPGDFVVAKNGGNEATFKKYRPRGIDENGNEVFELVPLNDDFAIMRSDATRLQVIGVMTEHRKRYRRGG